MRNLFFYIFISAVYVVMLSACATQQTIEILHINDTHSHLAGMDENGKSNYDNKPAKGSFARINNVIKKYPNALVIDAGDRFQGTLYFSLFGYEPIIKLDNAMDFTALTLGNHEFDNGCEFLNSYINELKTPVLFTNMQTSASCPLKMDHIKPFLIQNVNGNKIGIIGIGHDNPKNVSQACDFLNFMDYKTAIKMQIKLLKEQNINKIILITHLGLDKDIDIANNIADIDVIVGGHSHSYLGTDSNEQAEADYPLLLKSPNNEPVLVVQAKFGTEYLGYLKVNFDNNGVVNSFDGNPMKLTGEQDANINAILTPYNKEIFQKTKIIGSNTISMNDGLKECRQAECLSALLLSLAILEKTKNFGTQIALNNSGNSRMSFPLGDITELDLLKVFPFSDKIVIKELSGYEIKQALEHGVAKENLQNISSMLQPANLKYSINRKNSAFDRISNIQIKVNGKWKNINFAQNYKVAVNSYIANGKSGFEMIKRAKTIQILETTDIEALREYVIKHTPITKIETNLISFK